MNNELHTAMWFVISSPFNNEIVTAELCQHFISYSNSIVEFEELSGDANRIEQIIIPTQRRTSKKSLVVATIPEMHCLQDLQI